MTKTGLQQRFELLGSVLYHSRDRGYFSSGQRTCLHMERAALLHAQDVILLGDAQTAIPKYTIPEHLEEKSRQVLKDFE